MKKICRIKLKDIVDFKEHPFLVNNDESLEQLAVSIKENGLLNPLIVRKKSNGKYEMISGHRRKRALELIGETEANVYIKDFNDDEAVICMVDSNIYREKILPSEKAFAYKMKLDAIKHQGKKLETSETGVRKLESAGKISNESAQNIRRYIRLTYLIPELLELVDNTVKYDKRTFLTMGIKPAVELSFLNKDEQNLVYASITYEDLTPSHAQAIRIRELSKNGKLNYNTLEQIFSEKKGNQNDTISFNKKRIESAIPCEILNRDKRYIEKYIIEAIEYYKKNNVSDRDTINLEKLKI